MSAAPMRTAAPSTSAPSDIVRGAPLVLPTLPLVHRFLAHGVERPEAPAYAMYPRGATGPASRLTWGEWAGLARALAAAMLMRGVRAGDRVAIFAGNVRCWPIADMAVQCLGAVAVGVYPSSAPAQVADLLRRSAPALAVTDTLERAAMLREAARAAAVPSLPIVVDATTDEIRDTLDTWLARGAERLASDADAVLDLDDRIAAVTLDAPAAIIFTSGSTGEPKGAVLSHRYLAASAASIAQALRVTGEDSTLAFLPFSHAAERVFGQCVRVHAGIPGALVEHPADVFTVARDFAPTIFGGLPRIFERLYEAVVAEVDVGALHGSARDPRGASLAASRARAIVRARVGARCRVATSGGATLSPTVSETLRLLGLPVLGAYGQTEHLCVCMNRADDPTADTVGPPMPGTVIRVSDAGELLVARSALTFDGYLDRADDTRDAFTDDGAWLRTGDSATIDTRGYVRITGRIKELIALSTGRKVAPLPIESALAAMPLIAHAVCIGEGRKFLTALLILRRAVVEEWSASHGATHDATHGATDGATDGATLPWPEVAALPALREELQRAVDLVNATLAGTDRIKAFAVVTDELSVESGTLTQTLKVVRDAVAARHATLIETLYA